MDRILFATRLANRRKEMGYDTQYAFAQAYDERFPPEPKDKNNVNGAYTGIYGTIKNYESGTEKKCNPKLETVINICELLECDVDYLLGGINETTHDYKFIHDHTGLSEASIKLLELYNQKSLLKYYPCLIDNFILDTSEDSTNTLRSIANIALTLSTRSHDLSFKKNYDDITEIAGLNGMCQNYFMQFIHRYIKWIQKHSESQKL